MKIPGVTTTKDAEGRIKEITINAIEQPQAVEVLREAGLIESPTFKEELEQGITLEEAREQMLTAIRGWKWPK